MKSFCFTLVTALSLLSPDTFAGPTVIQTLGNPCRASLEVSSQAQLHYKTRLVFKPTHEGIYLEKEVVAEIFHWLVKKFPILGNRMDRDSFFKGVEWSVDSYHEGFPIDIKTQAFFPQGEQNWSHWALLFEHGEPRSPRKWRVEIGLTKSDEGLVFNITNYHWIRSDFIGIEPQPPALAVPRIVKTLIRNQGQRWKTDTGSGTLVDGYVTLKSGDAPMLKRFLEDESRQLPVVYVSQNVNTDSWALSPADLARMLQGTALVVAEGDAAIRREVRQILPAPFVTWNGALRVYLPGLDFRNERDAFRHRYFLETDIRTRMQDVLHAIFYGVIRSTPPRSTNKKEVASVLDVSILEKDYLTEKLQREISAIHQEPPQERSEELNLVTELANLYLKEADELRGKVNQLGEQLREKELTELEMQEALNVLARENAELMGKIAELEKARNAQPEKVIPRTHVQAIELIQANPELNSRLQFTDSAFKSAKNASYRDPEKTYEALEAMGTTLYDLYFVEHSTNVQHEFHQRTGIEIGGEGNQTKKIPRIRKSRSYTIEGEQHFAYLHLKIGSLASTRGLLRIYYIKNGNKLIITHVGDHLETAGTSRM